MSAGGRSPCEIPSRETNSYRKHSPVAENVFDMEADLEGANGRDGESGLEAALAASRRAETKSAQVRFSSSCIILVYQDRICC